MRMHVIGQTRRIPNFESRISNREFRIANFEFRMSLLGFRTNGLTNAVRHEFVMIANDRQTFVAVRKHSRSFLWCFECYAGLASGECMANGLTNAIRHQFAMIAK